MEISVRAEAGELVTPDRVELSLLATRVEHDKALALRALTETVDALVAQLREAGGVPLDPATEQQPLAWTVRSSTTAVEHEWDELSGRPMPSTHVRATAAVTVVVRDLSQLDDLSAALARQDAVDVQTVQWLVDRDNPAWRRVRAAAVREAVVRARDYAAALGGSVAALLQLADVGLLGDGGGAGRAWVAQSGGHLSARSSETPSLDPEPQELVAAVEARFSAEGLSLG